MSRKDSYARKEGIMPEEEKGAVCAQREKSTSLPPWALSFCSKLIFWDVRRALPLRINLTRINLRKGTTLRTGPFPKDIQ